VSALDALPPEFDRHRDALLIVETGACNPSGIVITLGHACRQVIGEGGAQRTDPAVRLIGLQLAFLLDVGGVIDPAEYTRLTAACRTRAGARTAATSG